MLSKAHVLGISAVSPEIMDIPSTLVTFKSAKEKLVHIKSVLNRKIIAKDYLQATINGAFIYVRIGEIALTPTEMKQLSQEYIKAGWGHVTFNLFKNDLSVNLWKTKPWNTSEYESYIQGKPLGTHPVNV